MSKHVKYKDKVKKWKAALAKLQAEIDRREKDLDVMREICANIVEMIDEL